MIKVLIVDDFSIDRENLKLLLESDPAFKHLTVVGTCENGIEAMDFMKTIQPDLIISDIEMPFMDGFELARSVRQLYPQIKIIFSSLYNEFDYARNALYLGGYGYLLKPVDAKELLDCIHKVTDKIAGDLEFKKEHELLARQLQDNKVSLIENLMTNLIYGIIGDLEAVYEKLELLDLRMKDCYYLTSLIEIDDFSLATKEMDIENKHFFVMTVLTRIRSILESYPNQVSVSLHNSHIIVVFYFPQSASLNLGLKKIHTTLDQISLAFLKSDISLSITVSGYSKDILCLKFLYEQCLYILRYKYLLGKGKVMYSSDIPSSHAKHVLDYNAIEKELRFLLNTGMPEEIIAYMQQLYLEIVEQGSASEIKSFFYYIMICLQNIIRSNPDGFAGQVELTTPAIWEMLFQFETVSDAQTWIHGCLIAANKCIREREFNKNRVIVEKTKKFIELNYQINLTLEVISEELFYSPNYINQIFKQETGETIFDYLTRFKMNKAKQLLAESQYKLYEIADKLGYSHTAYFSSLFKKHTGITPKDFRRQMEG